MKIKVLFILRDYEHGGIPRVLANLLACLDNSRIDADIFVCNPCGIFKNKMLNCHILPTSTWLRLLSCNYRKEKGITKFIAITTKIIRHCVIKFFHNDFLLDFIERKVANRLIDKYDVLWVCSEDIPAKIAQYTKGNVKKVIWIHNNYDVLYPEVEKCGLPDFLCYDKIVCVAKFAACSLVHNLQEKKNIDLSNRVFSLYNIVNVEEIRKQGNQSPNDPVFLTDIFTIVSVGRLAYQKQFDAIPNLAAKIKNSGCIFRWYIIGDGSFEMWQWIRDEICKYGVEKEVILLGIRSNPYAYIASADLMVVPSRYETYPTVINEAKVLGTPVIANEFTGVDEILFSDNGWFGPLSQIPEKILIAYNKGKLSSDEKRKRQIDFSGHNKTVMSEFYQIVEELCHKKH